jgi:nickel/cobalt exporter
MIPEIHAHALSAPTLTLLAATTAGVAVLHTLSGPDHYLPFIVMSRARRWSMVQTMMWTFLCGLGHVGSSVLLAMAGVVFGFGLKRVQLIEEFRGNIAAWALIAFGAVYLVWGLKRAWRGQTHSHVHGHGAEGAHAHEHAHVTEHAHAHTEPGKANITPWILFTIFVFGPCEPMIPLVMYPAAEGNWSDVWFVSGLFSLLTIVSMLVVVLLAVRGIELVPTKKLERYSHATAGATIMAAGCAIQFLGL